MNKTTHPIEPEELMAYLDGELPPGRAEAAADHLAKCRECQDLAADLQSVSRRLLEWQVESASSQVSRVADAWEERKKEPKPATVAGWRNWFAFPVTSRLLLTGGATVVTLALVVAVAVPYLMQRRGSVHKSVMEGYVASPQQQRNSGNIVSTTDALSSPTRPSKSPRVAGAASETYADSGNLETSNFTYDAESSLVQADRSTPDHTSNLKVGRVDKGAAALLHGPMIIRTAQLVLTTREFEKSRADVERILGVHNGYVGELNVNTPTGAARSLNATLRVPAVQLDATLSDLKRLGRVESEAQSGQEVTQQFVDLEARLANSRNTERRLTDILRERTGKLKDVLAVEEAIDNTRGEIEEMEAERKTMINQVDYATLRLTVSEEYKASLHVVPESTWTRIRNAAVDGYHSLAEGLISLALFVASAGPSLLFWAAVLFFPVRWMWRKIKVKRAAA